MKKKILMAIISVLVILQILVFVGCSSSAKSGSTDNNGAMNSPSPQYAATANGVSNSLSADNTTTAGSAKSGAVDTTTSSPLATTDVSNASAARKVIMSANLTLQTTTYDKSIITLEGLVNQYGGFIQDSSIQGTGVNKTGNARTASYTVRVPSDKLNNFISDVGNVGNLLSKSVSGNDISKDYFDTQTQLSTLNAEHSRVIAIMNKTTNMTDMLAAEQRLSDIDNQINQLTGELQQWDSLVDLSTVTITVNEVLKITIHQNSFGGQLGSTFSSSIDALVATFEEILKVITAIIPFAVFFGGIALIILLIMKFIKKRTKKTPEKPDKPIV